MSRALACSLGLLLVAMGGCIRPDLPPAPPPRPVAAHTPQAAPAPGAATSAPRASVRAPVRDEIAFYELMEAYGLKTSIDLVTGRRRCRNAANEVIVMPSADALVINGGSHALGGMIRWRDGVLYLPGRSRSLLAEHLRTRPLPRVRPDPQRFDGSAVDLAGWNRPTTPQPAAVKRTIRPGSLPAAWRVRGERRWRSIVIHHSATAVGSAESFHREHRKKWKNGLGYHFVIGNGEGMGDGEIAVGPRWKRQGQGIDGAHAGNKRYNKYGIGICLVGDFNGAQPTARQLASLRHLCRTLMTRYKIGKKQIHPHRDVRRGHTDCPGKRFPFTKFVRSV